MAASSLSCLSLYGQSGQSGRFSCEHGNLRLADLSQYGGNVDIDGSVSTLTANIVRGSMQTKSLGASSGFHITGGTVEVNSTTTAVANTIDWTDATDSIRFDTIKLVGEKACVSVAEGKALTDGTNVYTGTLSAEQIEALQGQTLVPYSLHHFSQPAWNWNKDFDHAEAVFRCTDEGCNYAQTVEAQITKGAQTDSTCTEAGTIEWEGEVEFEEQNYTDTAVQTLPKLRDMAHHDRVEPTKSEEGNIEHYTCNHCGKYFVYDKDTKDYVEVAPEDVVLPKLPAANGYSLTLKDDIQVNLLIDAACYGAEDGYIRYEYFADIHEETAEKILSEPVNIASLDVYTGSGSYQGNRILTLNAAPAQIAQSFTVYVYTQEGELKDTLHASISNYCEALKDNPSYGLLMSTLLNYGQLANEYFGYADKVGDDYAVPHSENYRAALNGAERGILDETAVAGVTQQGNAQIKGVSFIAQTKPEFKVYFKNTKSTEAAVSDDLTFTTEKTSDGVVVKITGLKASEFSKTFTVTVDGTEVTLNGYGFVKVALGSQSLKELAQGLFRYARAAEQTFI